MIKRRLLIVFSLIVILVGSYFLMQYLIAQKKDIPTRPPNLGDRWVEADTVKYTTIEPIVHGKGRVVSTAQVEIIAEASGKIEEGSVPLKTGQDFEKGDTLLTIYKDEVELELKAQKSRFLNTIANLLPDVKIDFPDKYDDFVTFFNAIDLEQDFPALPEIQTEKMKIFLASRNVLNDYYSIKRAEKQLDRHTIVAPFKGTFSFVNLQVGAYTNTGGRIGSIIRTDALEVEVPVQNRHAGFIRIGLPVKLTSIDRDLVWQGRVVRVSEIVDIATQSRSMFVKVPLQNQEPLFSGEYLEAEFAGMSITNAMEIPRSAVFNHDQVFIVENGRLQMRQIEILKVNVETIIFRGLPIGVFVVTQPLINVAENTSVKILGIDSQSQDSPKDQQKSMTAQY